MEHPSDYAPEEVEQQYSIFETSLKVIESEAYLLSLTTNWLNDNVRNFLTLLAEMSASLPTYRGRSTRGFVSSRLLERRSHSSLLRVFDAKVVHTDKYRSLNFVFLPLRLLAYLENRDSSVELSVVIKDFSESFGVPEGDIRRAIERFARSEVGKPYVLRLEPSQDGGTEVHLLSCGEAFVRHVVYECDYLQLLFDQIEDAPEVSPRLSNSEWKLQRALAVVDRIIIPAFEIEHPYLIEGVRATNRMRQRLVEYDKMFSFRHDRWFIGILRTRLNDYASARGLQQVSAGTIARLRAMEERLNFIVRGGR